ncbi:MAG: hypothetical protein M3Y57_20865 [Acidobacteriota bacterium]|nr:hypothetical protein [Acidobacteriota bacterium]
MPRTYDDNAWWPEEAGSLISGSTLFENKFKKPSSGTVNWHDNLKNFLDPALRPQRQPQTMPPGSHAPSRYDLFAGSQVARRIDSALASGGTLPELKVTLLFGVGQDLDNLGLRFFFEQVNDTILINIPGSESPRWNLGISGLKDTTRGIDEDQVSRLIAANYFGTIPHKITTLAAYSTGYGSLNQTVNEGLIPLSEIRTVVYYDCTYRTDRPAPASDDGPVTLTPYEQNSGPDEVDAGHAGSAFNMQRAHARIVAATGGAARYAGYIATSGGSPKYLHPSTGDNWQYSVDFATKIDLRRPAPGVPVSFAQCLFALILTRVLSFARTDGQINTLPSAFDALARVLPARGTVASSTATLVGKSGFSPTTTLLSWGAANKTLVLQAQSQIPAAIRLVSDKGLMYIAGAVGQGAYPDPSNAAGALHAALLPEFGWEFLL